MNATAKAQEDDDDGDEEIASMMDEDENFTGEDRSFMMQEDEDVGIHYIGFSRSSSSFGTIHNWKST